MAVPDRVTFHIAQAGPRMCDAVEACPRSDDAPHFANFLEAARAYEAERAAPGSATGVPIGITYDDLLVPADVDVQYARSVIARRWHDGTDSTELGSLHRELWFDRQVENVTEVAPDDVRGLDDLRARRATAEAGSTGQLDTAIDAIVDAYRSDDAFDRYTAFLADRILDSPEVAAQVLEMVLPSTRSSSFARALERGVPIPAAVSAAFERIWNADVFTPGSRLFTERELRSAFELRAAVVNSSDRQGLAAQHGFADATALLRDCSITIIKKRKQHAARGRNNPASVESVITTLGLFATEGPTLRAASDEPHVDTLQDAEPTGAANAARGSDADSSAASGLTLGLDHESTERIVRSANWGAAVSDQVDEHIASTGVRPEHISMLLYWDEDSVDGDAAHSRRYLFDATPRLDESLGKFTNIYRLAWWNPADERAQAAIDSIYASEDARDSRWARIPGHMKWEAAFGESLPVVDMTRNDWSDAYRKREEMTKLNDLASRSVLNAANIVDVLIRGLRDHRLRDHRQAALAARGSYERSLDRMAANVRRAIQAIENSVMGPYDSYDRGLGFYGIDDDRRTIVEENLSTTFVRGRHLQQLGLDAHRWLNGAWKGDIDSGGNTLNSQEAFARVAYSTDKGVPFESPMTFWTANTPDGSRWELGLDVRSPEAGSHRVLHFAAANPNIPTELATPAGPIEGLAALRASLEQQYGSSSEWLPELRRDMAVLADIVEGHRVMRHSAKAARDRMATYGR